MSAGRRQARTGSVERSGIHLTLADNLDSIGERGLLPGIGPQSKLSGATVPSVYLYADRSSVDEALSRRIGDLLAVHGQTVALLVRLDGVPYEERGSDLLVQGPIPVNRLEVLSLNIDEISSIDQTLREHVAARRAALRQHRLTPAEWFELSLVDRWSLTAGDHTVRPLSPQFCLPGMEPARPRASFLG